MNIRIDAGRGRHGMTIPNLDALNSATKYPSIETYHALDDRGSLTEDATVFTGDVVLTEKVNGASSRIIQLPGGDWFIGSREELLTARGDRVANPAFGIVAALEKLASDLSVAPASTEDRIHIRVLYLEVYGHRIGGAGKQYTSTGKTGCRLFDIGFIPVHMLERSPAQVAAWRQHGGQNFATEKNLAETAGLESLPLVPRLGTVPGSELPASTGDMNAFLDSRLKTTGVALDGDTPGRPEGIVLRTPDRSVIAKARFADYERTIRRRNSGKR